MNFYPNIPSGNIVLPNMINNNIMNKINELENRIKLLEQKIINLETKNNNNSYNNIEPDKSLYMI